MNNSKSPVSSKKLTYTFKGGIHPCDSKSLAEDKLIEQFSPKTVRIPLSQHIGAPATSLVKPGDIVTRGQLIGSAAGMISAPIHSSITGTVKAMVSVHLPNGRKVPAIEIEESAGAVYQNYEPQSDYATTSADELRKIVADSGIVGLGGATFPTVVKLAPNSEKTVDTILINAAECEPYLTADYRLILEQPEQFITGITLLLTIFAGARCIIGIEDNKPTAIDMIKKHISGHESSISLAILPVKYPQGAEKMLIKAATGRVVPAGKLPLEVGVSVHNVGTVVAIYEAVVCNKPLIDRIVTISGEGIQRPANIRVPIGTSVADLLAACGGLKATTSRLVAGGPMMGFALANANTVIIKGTSGILALTDKKSPQLNKSGPCIRCGRCMRACPMNLRPADFGLYGDREDWKAVKELGAINCFECGCCVYVCPSNRPLVHYVKIAKTIKDEKK